MNTIACLLSIEHDYKLLAYRKMRFAGRKIERDSEKIEKNQRLDENLHTCICTRIRCWL